MKYILLLFLLFTFSLARAQYGWNINQNGVWAFIPHSGLDFNNVPNPPAVINTAVGYSGSLSESYAAVADPNGQLLFYTNTDTIWDSNHQPMPDGAIGGINGITPSPEGGLSWNTSQGALILPVLDNPNRYYVFSLNGSMDICFYWAPESHKLKYSVVDMSLNNGLGDIVPGMKNLTLDSALGGMMTAAPGADCNIWLIAHDRDNPVFKAYEITVNGINTVPVLSTTGNFTGDWANKWGEMCLSPSGQKLAYATSANNSQSANLDAFGGVELYDFNQTTGSISNPMMVSDSFLAAAMGIPYSVCFSSDNSKLYYTLLDNIYQVNLALGTPAAIIASATMISDTALSDGGSNPVIRLGKDGKIYAPVPRIDPQIINGNYQSYLACINSPNSLGAASNFVRNAVPIQPIPVGSANDYTLGNGLGNYAFVLPLPGDTTLTTQHKVLCSNIDSVVLQATAGYFWHEWEDGSTGTQRTITQPGIYWVSNKDYCHFKVDTFIVKAVDVDIDLGNDTVVCNRLSCVLNAEKSGVQHLWSDGSTGARITATATGSYWVQISNSGCINADTILITFRDLRQDLGPDTPLCKGDPILYTVAAQLPGMATAQWSTGAGGSVLVIQDTGIYWVRVSAPPCEATDTIRVTTEWCDCSVFMPNAFSPNNDGLNDFLTPVPQSAECIDMGTCTLDVYNHWGQRVYQGRLTGKGWNGTYNGLPADVGTYSYLLNYKLGKRGTQHVQKGDVTLIR